MCGVGGDILFVRYVLLQDTEVGAKERTGEETSDCGMNVLGFCK